MATAQTVTRANAFRRGWTSLARLHLISLTYLPDPSLLRCQQNERAFNHPSANESSRATTRLNDRAVSVIGARPAPVAENYRFSRCGGPGPRLTRSRLVSPACPEAPAPAWSPDGKWLAFADCGSQPTETAQKTHLLTLVRADGNGRRVIFTSRAGIGSPTWH